MFASERLRACRAELEKVADLIDTISRQEQTLRFEMNLIGASYEGKLNAAGTEIMGEWRQQGRSWTLNFSRAGSGAK